MQFSVIITTYKNEKNSYFKTALLSIIKQTKQPNEIVILFDGPVSDRQKNIALDFQKRYHNISFKIINLPKNVGRGRARNIAVTASKYDLVAVMDSDDISLNHRFESQLKIFKNNDNIDIVASWQQEFNEEHDIKYIKACPESDKEIKKSLKFRCLIPNPSIMFKKNIFLKVGGYGENKLLGEDHVLFAKLAKENATFYCIQQPLIQVRINQNQRIRRGGVEAIKDDLRVRYYLFKIDYINVFELILYSSIFISFRILPVKLKDIIFSFIRKTIN